MLSPRAPGLELSNSSLRISGCPLSPPPAPRDTGGAGRTRREERGHPLRVPAGERRFPGRRFSGERLVPPPLPGGFPFHLPPPRGERSGQQGGGGSFSSSPLSEPGKGPPVHLIHPGSCSTRGFSTRFSTHGLGKSPLGISVTLPPKPEWRIWATNSQVKSEQPEGLECIGDSLKNAFWSI